MATSILALGFAIVIFIIITPGIGQEQSMLVARGKQLFFDQCYGCHTIGKIRTPIAPDLTGIGSRYSASYLTQWLRDPATQKPTAHILRSNSPRRRYRRSLLI